MLDFRNQGVYVAMAMVGNRLTRTFKKAGLTNMVREPRAKAHQENFHDAIDFYRKIHITLYIRRKILNMI